MRCFEGRVEGSVYGIKPALCCVECCSNFAGTRSKHYHRRLVSVSRARYRYHCTPEDLKVLNYKTVSNPVDPNGRRMRLFLGAEVEFIRNFKVEELRRESMIESVIAHVKERLAIEDKKNRLERILGAKLGDMDDVVRAFMLGDYLERSHGSQTSLYDVQQRFSVLKRVKTILNGCPKAHPGAVFDFCVSYPKSGVSDFLNLQERSNRALYIEGDRIMSFLSEEDRAKLTGLSLKEVIDRPRMSASEATIRWHLDFRGANDPDYLLIIASEQDSPYSRLILARGRRIEITP